MVNSITYNNNHQLQSMNIFISASIPDPKRWKGEFDTFGITDAVVALARAVLQNGGTLVTAAHPTISPLLLYVAAEQLQEHDHRILIYQSKAFESILPEATRRYEEDGIGKIIWTNKIRNDPADPAKAVRSLARMRSQMLEETQPVAGVFIGGMRGIPAEYKLFHKIMPNAPTYAFGRPGGEAKNLVDRSPSHLCRELACSDIYPTVVRHIIADLVHKQKEKETIQSI